MYKRQTQAESVLVTVAGNIVSATGPEEVSIGGTFDGMTTDTLLAFVASETPVRAVSVINLRLEQNGKATTTLQGEKDVATGQVMLGVVLDDGRQIPALMSGSGNPAFPGYVSFERADDASHSSVCGARVGQYPASCE